MAEQFIILSLKHTNNRYNHILMWAPGHAGYRFGLKSAGRYTKTDAIKLNDGRDDMAVPYNAEFRALLRKDTSMVDYGLVLPNNRETWERLLALNLACSIGPAACRPRPMWKGRPPLARDRVRICKNLDCVNCFPGDEKVCPSCGTPYRRSWKKPEDA